MLSTQYFENMPGDGCTLKDLINWFIASFEKAQKDFSEDNKYYSGHIGIGYLGLEFKEYPPHSEHIELYLSFHPSWSPEDFENVDVTIQTDIKLTTQESFFTHAESSEKIDTMLHEIKSNPIFSELYDKTISGHTIDFGEFCE